MKPSTKINNPEERWMSYTTFDNNSKRIELLAPGGDIDSIKAAIAAGTDAIYCGLNQFNARNRATNINIEDLNGVIHLAHKNNCKIFLTLNIIMVGSEIPYLIQLLNKLANTGIDAVIVQDMGLFYILSKYYKGIEIHASTQLNTHNKGQIKFISELTGSRVNLSRELSIHEINELTLVGQKKNVLTEVFVHGSYCISFSGLCYLSSVQSGNSGNRGRCSQPCRDRYLQTPEGKDFPLNLKDNSSYLDLKLLSDAGVASIKIEGRIKKYEYVYTVVNAWKKQLDSFYSQDKVIADNSDLYKVFNRDFSNLYLLGDINKSMFIDNPRDNSVDHLSKTKNYSNDAEKEGDHLKFYKRKEGFTKEIKNKINGLSIAKIPLTITITGALESHLNVRIKTPDTSFTIISKTKLAQKKEKGIAKCLTHKFLLERFKIINDTQYTIKQLELDNLHEDLFISFNEVTSIRKKVLSILNESKEMVLPIEVPFLKKATSILTQGAFKTPSVLSVLISSKKDLSICEKTDADIFFQLPNSFEDRLAELSCLFIENKKLIPWFPSVLIGEDYKTAVNFLEKVKPKQIVTNNTGIGYEAYQKNIPWIAGPYLNMSNSFSLLCLKEKFNCSGSFISNELSKYQLKSLIAPKDFKLYYSIYHPILLLTSRQCLMHQVTGCEKDRIDESCVQKCQKSCSITDMKNRSLYIKKTKGNYHSIYNNLNCLNCDIVKDLPGVFSNFLVDLRNIKTETKLLMGKSQLIDLFTDLLNNKPGAERQLNHMIRPTTNVQYKKGF